MTGEEIGRFAAALDALAPTGRVALAVSGGPDSLALLLLAHAAGREVIAATVDHRLRPEAADEAAMVAEVCRGLGVPHSTIPVGVTDDPAGLQAAARTARYAALDAWAGQAGAAWLATAHHLDDQAETVLMRLARGAGVAGLAGVRRSRPLLPGSTVTLIRPLLGWRKGALEAVVAAAGLTPAQDPSNTDPRFDRTRARALLAGGWPAPERIAAIAATMGEAEEALAWATESLVVERLRREGDAVTIAAAGVPRELRRRLLRTAIAALVPAACPRGDALDRLLAALDSGRTATIAGLRCSPGPPWRVAPAPPRSG